MSLNSHFRKHGRTCAILKSLQIIPKQSPNRCHHALHFLKPGQLPHPEGLKNLHDAAKAVSRRRKEPDCLHTKRHFSSRNPSLRRTYRSLYDSRAVSERKSKSNLKPFRTGPSCRKERIPHRTDTFPLCSRTGRPCLWADGIRPSCATLTAVT